MSKFLDRLEQITQGVSAPMGFGAPRAKKTPGMALVGLVSGSGSKAINQLMELGPDAVLVSGAKDPPAAKKLAQPLGSAIPWGARVSALSEEDARDFEEGGCDILAFSLQGTSVAAVGSEELARVLCVETDIETEQLRAVDALPIDILLLSMPSMSESWTLEDLATIARVSQRVDKYVLVEVTNPPGPKELEALRNAGVNGLGVDVRKVDAQRLSQLKQELLDMPRQRPGKKERVTAIVPGSSFTTASTEPEPDEEDDDDE